VSDVQRQHAGRVIDGFRLEQKIHEGGMATIWSVTHPDVAGPMVMKIPFVRHGEDPATILGFEVERMILPRLSGIHVPRFVATGDFEQPYIVMERVPGRSLLTRLPETPLPLDEVVSLGATIATALHAIHRQRVIHHDVKPSNVILHPEGHAVLIDLGFARHADLPDVLAEEIHGPVGTGPYVSPEELGSNRADPRSDLFALGVILYFLATGERPFGDPTRRSDWRRRLWRDPVPPRQRRHDVSPWLQEIILRCLEIDPRMRHLSAAALADDLRHPEQVMLTARAERVARDSLGSVAMRWLRARKEGPPPHALRDPRTTFVMVAVDLAPGHESLTHALRAAVRRTLLSEPGARLACVNVLKLSRLSNDPSEDELGRNVHLRRLAELKRWARPLGIDAERITYHVLESPDPAGALLEHARTNQVDHVVMGARASSTLRRFLGSVSSQVVAEAPCTVTVVRAPVDGVVDPAE
jgi:nucleotide-binding universal stress UspA family protein